METVCRNHNHKVEDAIESLRALSFTDVSARHQSQSFDSTTFVNCANVPGQSTATCELFIIFPLISFLSHWINFLNVSAVG